jgi:hypothetical protein
MASSLYFIRAHVAASWKAIYLKTAIARNIQIHYYYLKNVFTDKINWFTQLTTNASKIISEHSHRLTPPRSRQIGAFHSD